MDVQSGMRVRARGLIWEVLEVDRMNGRTRASLHCVEGDMAGLEWEIYSPPERLEPVNTDIDPRRPASLSLWRTMHWAHLLNELPDGISFAARIPGRVQIEPYQLVPLMRALDMPRPRLLLADGVGLGKTIQAGLIAVELIARRRAHRILIVVPSGPLVLQWEQETRLRFGLKFTLVTNAAELWSIRRTHELGTNPYDLVSLCITTLDFAKQDHVLGELERSAWDLTIIDEAHHCIGAGNHMSRENTQRRRLAEVLARRSDGLLLLTATPHDGHEAHFASLIELLDPSLVDGAGGFVGTSYRRHVIRRMKAHIRDMRNGQPLFRRRHVIPVKVDVSGADHETVRDFHRALSAFVVPRLRRGSGMDDALAFVSLLKRSVSTISACLETLRVVVDRISHQDENVETKAARRERARALRAWRRDVTRFGSLSAADEGNQAALEVEGMAEALRFAPDDEPARLIQLGVLAEPNDPKLSALLLEVRLIRLRHPGSNILIYTEYTDSQIATARILRSASGIEGIVLTIGGADDEHARAAAAQRFSEQDTLILVSTDSLSEGLNLHRHCFHLIHLDLPYNPNRLEQRNGRIDRYGQRNEPEIRYLYIPGTFEESLLLHLISKYEKARSTLDIMPDTLGVTAEPDDYSTSLMGTLSEVPDDLFHADAAKIRTLDRAVADSSPETVAELMRDIDHAFATFDLMAVCHGWLVNDGMGHYPAIQEPYSLSIAQGDLPDFVSAVLRSETGEPALVGNTIRLPKMWLLGLEDLPGYDSHSGTIRITRDFDRYRDENGQEMAYLGRAHPVVVRAISDGCLLKGAVAVCQHDSLALLQTFELEIPVSHHMAFRRIVGLLTTPDGLSIEVDRWLSLAETDNKVCHELVWNRLFAVWAEQAQAGTDNMIAQIATRNHSAFLSTFEVEKATRNATVRQWLHTKATVLCGAYVPITGDLFGGMDTEPVWRDQSDPLSRLMSFAAHPETSPSRRRMANDTIETFKTIEDVGGVPGAIMIRRVGMLMLVPEDVF